MTKSIRQILSTVKLDKHEAKLILCHVLNFTRAQIISRDDYILTTDEMSGFEQLWQKCQSGVPLNYILGFREFYSRRFKVTPDTLVPRPETELLVDTVLAMAKPGLRLLDLGTGSGCIAISAKLEYPRLVVEAVDKFPATLDVARENASALGAELDLNLSDWFTAVHGKYDIIVSNPPYIHPHDRHLVALSHEPQAALTDFKDGLSCLRSIICQAPQYLNAMGSLMVEHGFDQAGAVRELFTLAGFSAICTLQDYSGNDRITKGLKQ